MKNLMLDNYTIISAADSPYETKEKVLYKYITPVALAGLIEHGDIKLAYRGEANDPFECLPKGYKNGDSALSHLGIISFTTNPLNHPMWGNYAGKYRGACLEFSFKYFYTDKIKNHANVGEKLAMEGRVYKNIGTNVYFYQYMENGEHEQIDSRGGDVILKCFYSKQRSNPQNYEIFNGGELSEDENINRKKELLFQQNLWRQVSTKHIDWQYEDEYRITMRHQRCSRFVVGPPAMYFTNTLTRYITKIILGPNSDCSPWDVLFMINQRRKLMPPGNYFPENVKVVQAQFDKDRFDLDIPQDGDNLPDMY